MRYRKHCGPPPKEHIAPRVMCLSKILRQSFNEAIAEQGLFSGQEDIVLALAENEGITINELANLLDVSGATASVSIKRMEKAGFIIKKADKNDARITRLYPTEKAKLAPENIKKHMDSMEAVLKKNMTEEQALELSYLLDLAIQNIIERGEKE